MSNGLLDSSHRRPRRRASLIEELALPVTTLQRNRSSDSYHRPPSNNSRESSQSSSWEHGDTQLNNSSLPACLSDPSDHHDTNTTDAIRVHRPNWVKSTATTNNNHHMEQAAMSNSARTRRPRPQLLKSASMRSSFTFGRRSTAPDDINALLDGRNNDRQRKNGGGWNHRLSLGNGDRPDMKKVLEDNTTVLSDYQAVFQQMKLQNPTVSLGALQLKTMKRMSELKVEKEEMERMNLQRLRELEEKHHQQHGNNSGRMTLLGSLFHHRPRAGSDLSDKNSTSGLGSDRSDRDNNHNHNNSNHHGIMPKAPYNVDDSFRSNNSVDSSHHNRPNVLSRATILISRRASNQDNTTTGDINNYLSGRRSTIDTNPLSEADGSTDNNHNGNGVGVGGGGVPSILKTSLIMGEDQTGNFAPRKSVGDFTMMAGYPDSDEEDDDAMLGIMDRSRTSGLSKASGLFISGDESENFGGESDNIIGMRMGMESDLYNREEEDNFDNRDEEINYEELEILETHLQQLDTSHGSQPHCGDLNRSSHTFHSVISDSNQTTATEGSYTDSGSLIVGFGKQRDEKEDESRGFAADFSAWDNR